MFADDIAIHSENRVEETLKWRKFVQERRETKVSCSKVERMWVNQLGPSGRIRLQEEEIKKVEGFKNIW